jgi:hypothetical protein
MKISELTALLLAGPVLAAPLDPKVTNVPKTPTSQVQAAAAPDATEAEDFSDLVGSPLLGERDYEVGVLTPPNMPSAYVQSCLQYDATRKPGDQIFAQRIFGQPAHIPCNSSHPEKFTKETILAHGWVRFWHTKMLVPAAEFAKSGAAGAVVLARGDQSWREHTGREDAERADRATLAVQPIGGTWTQTPGGMATAGTKGQRWTFELVGRVTDRRQPLQDHKAEYDVRNGEKGECLQLERHYDGFDGRGHALEELAAFTRPCAHKEFSWVWTEIPQAVYEGVLTPPRRR